MAKRTLLIDGQVFQTSARDRGMGRYAACLVQAIMRTKTRHVELILTNHLPLSAADEAYLRKLFPEIILHKLDLWTVQKHDLQKALAHNASVLTDYVDKIADTNEVEYFIPSLFQEPLAAAFPEHNARKVLLFHDLIPYLYHERYHKVMLYENYLKRFKYIFEADLILTNSQSTADDLSIYLGIPKRKMQRIDGAAIHTDAHVAKPGHIDVSKKFILLNTSDDPRKNNLRSVLGFEEYRMASGQDINLVLTSTIQKKEREHLSRFSKHLQFTGNIPESELNWLYEHCEAVLFAPESEGLGLPVLEAVDANKKVISSSINVLREISTDAFYFCDHENSHGIAKAIERALDTDAKVSKKAYQAIQAYYSWDMTAERALAGMNKLVTQPHVTKPKIAIFMATPGGLSGVGLTGSILHPVLAEYFDIEYYVERGLSGHTIRPDYLQYVAPCYPAQTFSVQRYKMYDAVVYHLGNGDYHLETIKNALYLPGYAIVHDTNLREAFRVLVETSMMSANRMTLEEAIDRVANITDSSYFTSVANNQLGVLTHSDYAQQAMSHVLYKAVPIQKTGLPTNVPELITSPVSEKIVIGLAGAIADVKGLGIIAEIAADPAFANCDIRLFGFNHASEDALNALRAYDNVSIATNVSDLDFQASFAKLDIFVNYRMIYKGETSNTTLEAMRQGVVTIVRDIGWFAELAEDVVIKVPSPEAVIDILHTLVNDRQRLQKIGERARQYVATQFTQEKYAHALIKLLKADISKNPNALVARKLRSGAISSANELRRIIKEESKGND